MQLFAYLKTAKISEEDLTAIREAGIIPVAVESFDDIQVIEFIAAGDQNVMIQAALKAIKGSTYSTREDFAKHLIDAHSCD